MIHVHPLVLQIRFYDAGVDINKPLYQMHDDYRGIVDVMLNDLGIARLSGFRCDDFTSDDYESVKHSLKKLGVLKVEYRHGGKDVSLCL